MAALRHKKRREKETQEPDDKKISRMFTKILLSIIFLLSSNFSRLNPNIPVKIS